MARFQVWARGAGMREEKILDVDDLTAVAVDRRIRRAIRKGGVLIIDTQGTTGLTRYQSLPPFRLEGDQTDDADT